MTSEVVEFYRGKNIFLTGGTGFLGLAIVEKVLRVIPEIGSIYLLIRPKRGKSIEQRLEDLTKNPIFEKLLEKTDSTDIFRKLIPISGDVGDEDLGLSTADRQILIDNVHVVIHSAATLDFQEALRPTVNVNFLGTRRVMELSKQLKNLKAHVHVSSAYVNAFLLETREMLYPEPEIPEKVIDLVSSMNDEALAEVTPKLLKDHPNTYTFTKHLAEHEVNKCAALFPCAIVRPSMITAAWHEPIPGWTNSKNGPQGFIMGASKGVVRRLPVNKEVVYDYIPVDTVVNEILVSGWHVNKQKTGKIDIFHCTSSTTNPFRWTLVSDKMGQYLHAYPSINAVWYPNLKLVPTLLLFKISAIFVHFIPGFFLDLLLRLGGGRPILIRLHKNIWNSLNLLAKFIFTEWKFHNTNTMHLWSLMDDKDRELFNLDISGLYWPDYFKELALGVRRYLNNEMPSNLPKALAKQKRLFIYHCVFQVFIHLLLWWLVATLMGTSMMKVPWVVFIIYLIFTIF